MGLNLYKCRKKLVCKSLSEDKVIQEFMDYVSSEYNTYIPDKNSLRDFKGTFFKTEEEFEILDKFFKEYDLYDYDLVVEE